MTDNNYLGGGVYIFVYLTTIQTTDNSKWILQSRGFWINEIRL